MAEIHQWRGLKELEDNLKMLDAEMHERGVKRMMARAAVPMRDDAKRRAPVLKDPDPRRRAGVLRERIRLWRHRATQYAVTYYVGVRGLSRASVRLFKTQNKTSAANNPEDPFYWRWQELGIPSRGIGPKSFMRKAFESQKMASVHAAIDAGQKFIRQIRFRRTRA